MPTDFERQLKQMIPFVREPFVCRIPPKTMQRTSLIESLRIKSFVKVALGFVLGVVTYHVMLPNGDPPHMPAKTFTVTFDESALRHARMPADIFRGVVRVPVVKEEPTESDYRELRTQLLLDKET